MAEHGCCLSEIPPEGPRDAPMVCGDEYQQEYPPLLQTLDWRETSLTLLPPLAQAA